MPTRKKKKAPEQSSIISGLKSTVVGQRNGFVISIDGVDAEASGDVLAGIIAAFQQLTREFPDELLADLGHVGAGFPTYVPEGDFAGDRLRKRAAIGFDVRPSVASPSQAATGNQ